MRMVPAGARDAALIACMYPGGLRRDEVIKLDLVDYDHVILSLNVKHGKRNK
jgi:site-specific recombinase XerD